MPKPAPNLANPPQTARASSLPESHFRDVRRVVLALIVATVVLPTIYVAISMQDDWHERVDASTDTTVRAARVAQQQAVKLFDIDAALIPRLVERVSHLSEAQTSHSAGAIRAQMRALGADYPQILSINVFGRDGALLVSSEPVATRVNVSDREDFRAIRNAPALLHISQPMVSRITGERTFNVAQGWTDARDAFAGMVSVSMQLAYYRDFFGDLRAPDSPLRLGLVTAGAVPLVGYPDDGNANRAADIRDDLARALRQRDTEGALRVLPEGGASDDERIVAYRRVGTYDAYVVASWPIAPLRAAWLRKSTQLVLTTLVPCAALVLLLVLYLRRLRREESAWQQLDAQRETLAALEREREESQRLETLGNMVAMVAHDFNNVLMAIAAHTARGARSAADAQQALEAVQSAIEKGQALTRRLLGVARKQPLHEDVVDLHAWGGFPLLRSALGDAVIFDARVEPDVWPVRVDAAELELALLNLAVNARDAMPGGGRVELHVGNAHVAPAPEQPAADYVRLTVRDSGQGMDDAIQRRAFEPFFTTKPAGRGTGLGLAQVRTFCERSGGFVTLDSEPGRGSTVCLYLPRSTARAPARVDAAPYASAHRPLQLLFVEDDPLVAQAQQALFESRGHAVICVGDADEALATLAACAGSIDAVVSDVQLPGPMSGVRLAAEIRRRYAGMSVTLLTGFAHEPLDGLDSLDVQVFAKPCNADQLERHLLQHAGHGAGAPLH